MNSSLAVKVPAHFPVRRLDIDFTGLEKYWYDGQAGMTFFWSLMSALFPHGEQFFIDSVRHFRDKVTDPQLQANIAAFIGQEAMHKMEHASYNQYMTEVHGVNLMRIDSLLEVFIKNVIKKRKSPVRQLAMTVAAEHFTAIMAKHFMSSDTFYNDIKDPRMQTILYWHAIEESEHKAVAFDVLKQVDPSYIIRISEMVNVTAQLLSTIAIASVRLLAADGQLTNLSTWRHYGKTLIGRNGFFTSMLKDYFYYYHPNFHPNDHQTESLENFWKEKLLLAAN